MCLTVVPGDPPVSYRISSNNGRGDYFFFRFKRGQLFEGRRLLEGGDYFKYCSLKVVPQLFCFIIPLIQKIIMSNKLNMGF